MRQRFDNKNGRVLYFHLEPVSLGYPIGTKKLELSIYPEQGSKYSSFIYTLASEPFIEGELEKIAEEFLVQDKGSYGVKEISDILKKYVPALFPKV